MFSKTNTFSFTSVNLPFRAETQRHVNLRYFGGPRKALEARVYRGDRALLVYTPIDCVISPEPQPSSLRHFTVAAISIGVEWRANIPIVGNCPIISLSPVQSYHTEKKLVSIIIQAVCLHIWFQAPCQQIELPRVLSRTHWLMIIPLPSQPNGCFHSHGGTPIAGWFISGNITIKYGLNMDDDWGYPYLRKAPNHFVALFRTPPLAQRLRAA